MSKTASGRSATYSIVSRRLRGSLRRARCRCRRAARRAGPRQEEIDRRGAWTLDATLDAAMDALGSRTATAT